MIHAPVHNFFYNYYASLIGEGAAAALSVLTGLMIGVFGSLAAIKISNIFFNRIIRKDELHLRFMHSLVKLLCILGGIILMLIFFGFSTGLGRLLLGSTGLAIAIIGFAAQTAIGDVIAGLMIGISRPYKLGDMITLEGAGVSGVVRDMTIRHTVIHCFDGLYEIVPNSVVNNSIIHNNSYQKDLTGSYLEFGISYDSDVQLAMRIIHDAVISCRHTVEFAGDNPEGRRAAVYMTDYGESAVILRTTIWARDADELFLAKSEIMVNVKSAFEASGIEIPYNYVNVVQREHVEREIELVWDEEKKAMYEEGTADVLKSVDNFCKAQKIRKKDAERVRLLAEELMELMKDYHGSKSYFNISLGEGSNCELHYKVGASVSDSDRRILQALDTSGGNGLLSGIVRNFMSGYRVGGIKDEQWSLSQYREDIRNGKVPMEGIGASIITSLADDIKISVKNGTAEIIILKNVKSAA